MHLLQLFQFPRGPPPFFFLCQSTLWARTTYFRSSRFLHVSFSETSGRITRPKVLSTSSLENCWFMAFPVACRTCKVPCYTICAAPHDYHHRSFAVFAPTTPTCPTPPPFFSTPSKFPKPPKNPSFFFSSNSAATKSVVACFWTSDLSWAQEAFYCLPVLLSKCLILSFFFSYRVFGPSPFTHALELDVTLPCKMVLLPSPSFLRRSFPMFGWLSEDAIAQLHLTLWLPDFPFTILRAPLHIFFLAATVFFPFLFFLVILSFSCLIFGIES